MTDGEIREIIASEYFEYRNRWFQRTKIDIWNNSLRINAWECLYTFFAVNQADLKSGVLQKLYELSKGHIVAELVEEYIDQERCDITQYDDIRWLIDEYISYMNESAD